MSKRKYIQLSTHMPTYRRQVILRHIKKYADKFAKMTKDGIIHFSVWNGNRRMPKRYNQEDCDRIFEELYG